VAAGYVDLPDRWVRTGAEGPAPFVTRETFRRPDGSEGAWESRTHRKRSNRLNPVVGSRWWAPGAVAWWIGVLFMIGSACFAAGSMPGYAGLVGATVVGWTFFVGSIFFTSAGLLQYLEAVNAHRSMRGDRHTGGFRIVTWEPARIDWWASLIQLAGTVFFNLSTFHALQTTLTATEANELIWRPDALGSVCFLVASGLAWAEAGHAWVSWLPRSISWQIAGLNLLGSIAFGFSAVASKIVPDSGDPRNITIDDLGTFVGAICFLVGALLLLVERADPQS
jgi:YrhK-like protein